MGSASCEPGPVCARMGGEQPASAEPLSSNPLERMKASAVLSLCGKYRYELCRAWDTKPAVLFIGLNPSTADATQEDNTSRVCINYAKNWGFGTLLVGNLFAFRSTDPTTLRTEKDPIGPENDKYLRELQSKVSLVICAWGNLGALLKRDEQVLRFLNAPHCLVKLKSGRPGHPLYKSASLHPIPL